MYFMSGKQILSAMLLVLISPVRDPTVLGMPVERGRVSIYDSSTDSAGVAPTQLSGSPISGSATEYAHFEYSLAKRGKLTNDNRNEEKLIFIFLSRDVSMRLLLMFSLSLFLTCCGSEEQTQKTPVSDDYKRLQQELSLEREQAQNELRLELPLVLLGPNNSEQPNINKSK